MAILAAIIAPVAVSFSRKAKQREEDSVLDQHYKEVKEAIEYADNEFAAQKPNASVPDFVYYRAEDEKAYVLVAGQVTPLTTLGHCVVQDDKNTLFLLGASTSEGKRTSSAVYTMKAGNYIVFALSNPYGDGSHYFFVYTGFEDRYQSTGRQYAHRAATLTATRLRAEVVTQYHIVTAPDTADCMDDSLCRIQYDGEAQLTFDCDTLTIDKTAIKQVSFNMATLYTGEATDRYVLKADDIAKHYIADGDHNSNVLVVK